MGEDGEARERATQVTQTRPAVGGSETERTVEKGSPSLQKLAHTRPQSSFPFMLRAYLPSLMGSKRMKSGKNRLWGGEIEGFLEKGIHQHHPCADNWH